MNKGVIECTINVNHIDGTDYLNFKIVLDNETKVDEYVSVGIHKYTVEFDEELVITNRVIQFIINGKTDSHTIIENGNVVDSETIEILNLSFSDTDVTKHVLGMKMGLDVASYTHDFNGHGESETIPFDQLMGFNGVGEIKFVAPIYIWAMDIFSR